MVCLGWAWLGWAGPPFRQKTNVTFCWLSRPQARCSPQQRMSRVVGLVLYKNNVVRNDECHVLLCVWLVHKSECHVLLAWWSAKTNVAFCWFGRPQAGTWPDKNACHMLSAFIVCACKWHVLLAGLPAKTMWPAKANVTGCWLDRPQLVSARNWQTLWPAKNNVTLCWLACS